MSFNRMLTFCTKSGYCDLTPQAYFIPGFLSEISQFRELRRVGMHLCLPIKYKRYKIYLGAQYSDMFIPVSHSLYEVFIYYLNLK